jgi:hypothetical protein
MSLRKLTNCGDTIIEVLVCIAILMAVLSGAYLTANRSLENFRHSQERLEATKLAESQIEKIKQVVSEPLNGRLFDLPNAGDRVGRPFCLSDTGLVPTKRDLNWSAMPSLATDPLSGSLYPSPQCFNIQGRYNLSIVYTQTDTDSYRQNQFTVRVRWFKLGGGKEEVKMEYQLHD